MKRLACFFLCLVLLLTVSACGAEPEPFGPAGSGENAGQTGAQDTAELRAAVLYAGDGEGWHDTWSRLDQALLADLTVTALDAADADADACGSGTGLVGAKNRGGADSQPLPAPRAVQGRL